MTIDINDELILGARLLLATLFLIFGWRKLRDYSGTVNQLVQLHAPALIGHRYWTVTGADRVTSMDGFYNNLCIMGGFLLLYVSGAGKYSIDALRTVGAP